MPSSTVPSSTVPNFESPVTKTYPAASSQELTLTDLSSMTKMLVKGENSIDVPFGASKQDDDVMIWGSRPGEWTIVGSSASVDRVVQTIDTSGHTSVIDHTHSRALFRLSGQASASTMEKVCGLDLTNAMTPDGAVVSASVAKVGCDIARADEGKQSYLIACDRSLGQYLFDALLDSGDEFGIAVM